MNTPFQFNEMPPEVKSIYDDLMRHADNCQADLALHEGRLPFTPKNFPLIASYVMIQNMGNVFPGIRQVMNGLEEESRQMENEARDLAYVLLKTSATQPGISKKPMAL